MNILVVGNGGREAAIVKSLQTHTNKIFISPNTSTLPNVISSNIASSEHEKLLNYIQEHKIELVIVGPELPLHEGLSDFLRSHQVLVFGPSKTGADLECSKIFCKQFLIRADIPTSPYEEVFSKDHLLEQSKLFQPPWIVKADGLAAGKGVYICHTKSELETAGQELFVEKKLGTQRVFLENFLPGKELSYLVLTNGKDFQKLPIAQDHKRIFENDKGPNTGGMGTVAPLIISDSLESKIQKQIVEPFLLQLQKDQIDYRGVIYFGIMVQDENPYVLEINARFGDPEAQVLIPLVQNNWTDVFYQIAQGQLPKIETKDEYRACVVLAAPGYPDAPEKNLEINGDFFEETLQGYFLPAGVSLGDNKNYVTSGGRVLNCVGSGLTAGESLKNALALASKIHFKNAHFRKDIGQKVLKGDHFEF